MADATLNRDFLHRACIQFSSPLEEESAVEAESKHALRFVRLHATSYAAELAKALIWRVVDTNDDNEKDRVGAWTVLNSVLSECGEADSGLSRTVLADMISKYLPALIAHRWFSTMVRRPGAEESHSRHNSSSSAMAAINATSDPSDLHVHEKVISAETINRTLVKALDAQTVYTLSRRYKSILQSWRETWRRDVYEAYHSAVKTVHALGNELTADGATLLAIPASFRDSLWRLRRKSPRPSLALQVLYAYGWAKVDPNTVDSAITVSRSRGRRLPQTVAEVEGLDSAMHPGVRKLLLYLMEKKGGCLLCDTWRHTEIRCPCELRFARVAAAEDTTDGDADITEKKRPGGAVSDRWHQTRQLAPPGGVPYTFMEAVDRLYSSGLTLPLQTDEVLDHITDLIERESPYEEIVTAFDTVRGAVSGPEELHALWLHASYLLRPSFTVFGKPSDDTPSPAMEKAGYYLRARRRLREWDQLQRSVEVLDAAYRSRRLPVKAEKQLEDIRETSSFFFCLIDGSLPVSFTPGKYARVPEEVVGVARLKDILCHACLEPFHVMERCPHTKDGCKQAEHWDLQVARIVLEENGLLDLRRDEVNGPRVDDAMRRIDEDDRQAKDFRKNELRLAMRLIVTHRVPYCAECRVCGHSTARCEVRARRVFARAQLREVDVRLDSRSLFRRLRELRTSGDEMSSKELRDAYGVLAAGARAFPSSYMAAIRELDDARVPLAAARYSTDAVQGFLLHINSGDLLGHLRPLRVADFPDVCLFCDSYHHATVDCKDVKSDERGFLLELKKADIALWQYLRSPQYYDVRLPTDYDSGKRSVVQLVRQFDKEYGPGGIARQKFIEHNGLEGVPGLSQTTGISLPAMSQSQTLGRLTSTRSAYLGSAASQSLITPLYGRGFSQLIEPRTSESGTATAATAADAAIVAADIVSPLTRHGAGAFLHGLDIIGELHSQLREEGESDAEVDAEGKRARENDGGCDAPAMKATKLEDHSGSGESSGTAAAVASTAEEMTA